VFDPFQRLGKRIWTPKEEVDVTTDNGFLTSGILGVLGGIERKLILRRTLDGKEALRKQGRHVNGDACLPRGVAYYRPPKEPGVPRPAGQWTYVEPDRSRILLAFKLLFEHRSWREIADKVGGGWTPSGLNRALQNPVWKAERVYGIKTDHCDRRREEPLTVKLPIEPLINPERWQAAQELIRSRRDHWRGRLRGGSPFLATGLLVCSCGRPYYSRTDWRSKKGHNYYCASRFPKGSGCGAPMLWQAAVDRAIENMIRDCFCNEEDNTVLPAVLDAACRTSSGGDSEKKDIDREVAKLGRKRQQLIDLLLEEVIDKPTFNARLTLIDQKLRDLRAARPTILPAGFDVRKLGRRIVRAFQRFGKATLDDKRELLKRAVREFRVENQAIPSLTFSGGFLGELVPTNSLPRLSALFRNLSTGRSPQLFHKAAHVCFFRAEFVVQRIVERKQGAEKGREGSLGLVAQETFLILLLWLVPAAIKGVESATALSSPVRGTTVPSVSVHDNDATRRRKHRDFRGMGRGRVRENLLRQFRPFVRTRNNACGSVVGCEIIKQPDCVTHPVAAIVGNGAGIAVQRLSLRRKWVRRTRIEAAELKPGSKYVRDEFQHFRVNDHFLEDFTLIDEIGKSARIRLLAKFTACVLAFLLI
jgi:hypothetical protein